MRKSRSEKALSAGDRRAPLLSVLLLLGLPACLCPRVEGDLRGDWEVVEASTGKAPEWIDEPGAGAIVGFSERYDKKNARAEANWMLVKNAAATRNVHVESVAWRRDTEDSTKFREKTRVQISQDISVEVTNIYWERVEQVSIRHGMRSIDPRYRYWVRGIVIDS